MCRQSRRLTAARDGQQVFEFRDEATPKSGLFELWINLRHWVARLSSPGTATIKNAKLRYLAASLQPEVIFVAY
jgi:hypothetical protein